MISYDNYINRIQKVAKAKNFVVKYKFLFIAILAVIIAGTTALLATKGMVTSAMVLDAQYSYGENYNPTSATAFLSDVTYEYSVKGTDEWTDEKPVKVGTYLARTVTNKTIGKGYGDPVEFEILPKEVELAITSNSFTYGDSPACSVNGLVSSYGDRVESSVATYALPKTDSAEDMQVEVTVDKVVILDKNGNDSSDCYVYSPAVKTLTLLKRDITLTPVSRTETYSGAPVSTDVQIDPSVLQTVEGFGDKITSYDKSFTLGGSPVAAPQNAATYGITVSNAKFFKGSDDVTHLYKVADGNGTLTVAKKSLSITTPSAQQVYDGNPLSKTDGVANDGLISGHNLVLSGVAPSVTDADSKPNTLNFAVYDASNTPVTDNYNISYTYGTLTVTPRPVTVTLNNIANTVYGNAVTYNGGGEKIENAIGNCTVGVSSANLKYNPKGANTYPNAGSYEVLCDSSAITIYNGGSPVTKNYTVTVVGGSLEIIKRDISVSLSHKEVEYGATLPSHIDLPIGGLGLANGESFNPAYLYNGEVASLLGVGQYVVTLDTAKCTFTNRSGGTVPASNYNIAGVNTNTLYVTHRGITVYLNDGTAVYGNAISYVGGYKRADNLANGQTVEVDATQVTLPTGTPNVGNNYAITCPVNAIKILSGTTDVTTNYTVAVVQGTFTVTKRPITVKAEDMSGVIYGEAINYTGNYAGTPDLVSGETLTVLNVNFSFNSGATPSVGAYNITPTDVQILKADGTDSLGNYQITPANGTLTIVQRPIKISSVTNQTFIYDGTAQFDDDYEIVLSAGFYGKLSSHRIAVTSHATVTDVAEGAVTNRLTYAIYDSLNNPVTTNYKITDDFGTLKVNPRDIEVTLNSYTATYGDPYLYQTGAGNYAGTPDLVGGDTLEVTAVTYEFGTTQFPDVRAAAYWVRKASYAITKPDGASSYANYNVTWHDGALTIEKREITVQLNTYSATYGDRYAYATGAGNYANAPELVNGDTLEITKVIYEFGTTQYPDVRDTAYSVTLDEYVILKKDGTSSYGNYTVYGYDGALTITPRAITVTLNDIENVTYGNPVEYNNSGEAIYNAVGDCTVQINTDNLQYSSHGDYSYPDAGYYGISCSTGDITVLSGGRNVTDNYTVTVVSGSLTIDKRDITVKAQSYTVTYGDGFNYLTCVGSDFGNYEGETDLVDGETLKITAATYSCNNQPSVGKYSVTPTAVTIIKADGATNSNGNYTVAYESCELKVTKRDITVTFEHVYFVYGYSENYAELYKVFSATAEDLPYDEELNLTLGFTQNGNAVTPKELGDYDVIISDVEILNSSSDAAAENYNFIPQGEAILTIDPRMITVNPYKVTVEYGDDYHYRTDTKFNYEANQMPTYRPCYGEEIVIFIEFDVGGQTVPEVGLYNANITGAHVYDGDTVYEDFRIVSTDRRYDVYIGNFTLVCYTEDLENKLEITPREITVKLYDNEIYYGDSHDYVAIRNGAYEDITQGSLVTVDGKPETLEITSVIYEFGATQYPNASAVAYTSTDGTAKITKTDGTDGTANYNVSYEGGSITINKRPVVVNIQATSCLYGTETLPTPAHTVTGVDGKDGLVNGDALNITSFIRTRQDGKDFTRFDVGKYNVSLGEDYTFTYGNGSPSTVQNYEITDCNSGTLTINKRQITIGLQDTSFTYGEKYNTTVSRLYWHHKESYGKSYLDKAWEDLFTVGGDGFAKDEGFRYVDFNVFAFGTDTPANPVNAGKYTYAISEGAYDYVFTDFSDDNTPNTTDNYNVTILNSATLEILPQELIVNLENVEMTYGDREKAFDGYLIEKSDGLAFNQSLTLTKVYATKEMSGGSPLIDSYLGAGTYYVNANPADVVIYDEDGAEIENGYLNYNVKFNVAVLTVKPRLVTVALNYMHDAIYGDDNRYVISGKERVNGILSFHTFEIDPDKITFGDGSVAPNKLNVGTYAFHAAKGFITIFSGTTDVTANYSVEINNRVLIISPRKITVTLSNATNIYGEEKGKPEITITGVDGKDGLVNGDEFTPAYLYLKDGEKPARYDVGDYDITLDEENYSFTYANGSTYPEFENYQIVGDPAATLKVTPRPITITLKDITLEYGDINSVNLAFYSDRGEITNDILEVSGEYGLASDEMLYFLHLVAIKNSDGKRPTMKDVGSYDVEIYHLYTHRVSGGADPIIHPSILTGSNYVVSADSKLTATVTIIPKKVEVNVGDYTITYGDEEEWWTDSFTTSENLAFNEELTLSKFLVEGDFIAPLNASTTPYKINGAQEKSLSIGSLGNYEITVKGTVTVGKKSVTIELLPVTPQVYGAPLTYPARADIENGGDNFTITDGGFAYGQTLDLRVVWWLYGVRVTTPKNAATYSYQFDYIDHFQNGADYSSKLYDADGNEIVDGLDNYQFKNCKSGTATISKFGFSVNFGKIDAGIYGNPLEYSTAKYYDVKFPEDSEDELPYQEKLEITIKYFDEDGNAVKGDPTEVGKYTLRFASYRVFNADGTPSEYENYLHLAGENEYGSFEIIKRDITVTAMDLPNAIFSVDTVSYPVYAGNHGEIGGKGLPEGQNLTVTSVEYYDQSGNLVDGVPTMAGTYYIVPTSVIITYTDDEKVITVDIDRNYEISYPKFDGCGTVTILPRNILLKTFDGNFVYNGLDQSQEGFELWLLGENGEPLRKLDELTPEQLELASVTNYKTVRNVCTGVENTVDYDFSALGYHIAATDWGTLSVTARPITLVTEGHTFTYNGAAQFWHEFSVTNGLDDIHEYEISWKVTVQDKCQNVANRAEITAVYDKSDDSKTNLIDNYAIQTPDFGLLNVDPRPISVQSATNTEEWTYDGKEHRDLGFTWINNNLVKGHDLSVTDGTAVIDVSAPVDNKLTYKIVDENGNDVTDNYNIDKKCGKLKVNARSISVTPNSNPNLVYGDTVYPNDFGNYANTPNLVAGEKLCISVIYEDINGAEYATVKNVGTYTVALNGIYVEKADGSDSTGNYEIDWDNCESGSITISPKTFTFALENLTKVYGEAFNGYPAATVYDDLEYGEGMTVSVAYSAEITERTDAGNYAITIDNCTIEGVTYGNPVGGVIDCGNYIITFTDGELEITRRQLYVYSGSASKPYDGTELTCTAYDEEKTFAIVDGVKKVAILDWDKEKAIIRYKAGTANSILDSGTTPNRAKFESASKNYEVARNVSDGILQITQVSLKISLWEIAGEYFYGDTPAYIAGANNFDYVSEEKCVAGEQLEIAVYFTDENGNVVEPKNTGVYTYAFDYANSTVHNAKGDLGVYNYLIECTNDDAFSVEVQRLSVTVTLDSWANEEYDGAEHTYGCGYTVAGGNDFAYGETLSLSVDYYSVAYGVETLLQGELPKNAGNYAVKYNAANSTVGGEDPERNYQIKILPEGGISFTITPKNITISMGNEARIYNGNSYNYPAENTKFVAPAVGVEKIIPVVEYSCEEAPVNAGTYTVTLTDFTVQNGLKGNYQITNQSALDNGEISCSLTIEKRDISFSVNNATMERGADIPAMGYSVGGFGFVSGEQAQLTPVYTYFVEQVEISAEDLVQTRGNYTVKLSFTDESGILANYNVTSNTDGNLEVTARKVTVNISYTGGEFTYDGEAIELDGVLTFTHVHTTNPEEEGFIEGNVPEYRYSFTNGLTTTYTAPVNAGVYTVKVEFLDVDEDDYTIYNTGSVTITVNPRPVTVEVTCSGYNGLTYSNEALPRDGVSVTFDGILEADKDDYSVEWYFYNDKMGEVTVNYAGDYQIRVKVSGANANYQVVDYVPETAFTISPITVYVTPVGEKVQYKGEPLSLTKYDIKDGAFLDGDVLSITGSSTLVTTIRTNVTIASYTVMQGSKNVTHCYDVHHKYDAADPFADPVNGKPWYTSANFTATLEFIPIEIRYTQVTPDETQFDYDGTVHPLTYQGQLVSSCDLSKLINIENENDFKGPCNLQLSLMQIKLVGTYEKWIIILVTNQAGQNVSTLYNFKLQNKESAVVVRGYDFKLEINDAVTDASLKTAIQNNDSTVFAGTATYGNNVYYILNSNLYTATGLTERGHECEVLVREVNGAITVKVIVFETTSNGTRSDKALYYSFDCTSNLSNVEKSMISLLRFDKTN